MQSISKDSIFKFFRALDEKPQQTNIEPHAMYYTNQIKNLMKLGMLTDKDSFVYHEHMKVYDINKGKPARYKEYLEDAPNPKRVHFDIDTYRYKHKV